MFGLRFRPKGSYSTVKATGTLGEFQKFVKVELPSPV